MKYEIYIADTETTGLDSRINDVIEISMYRLSNNEQKTWHLQPLNPENMDKDALRVNGHIKEDLLHLTDHGKLTYKNPKEVVIEMENWILDDDVDHSHRILCGQNIAFDRDMLEQLWIKCDAGSSFPFGYRMLDTMHIDFYFDLALNPDNMAEGYSLKNLCKKYGVKNEKSHTAAADVKATQEVFLKQLEFIQNLTKNA